MYWVTKAKLERRFWWGYGFLVIVGLGSGLFHGTLTYWTQLLDEVPMLFGSSNFIYCAFDPWLVRPPLWAQIAIYTYPAWVTAVYIMNRSVDFFQIFYGLMPVTIGFQAMGLRRYFAHAVPGAMDSPAEGSFGDENATTTEISVPFSRPTPRLATVLGPTTPRILYLGMFSYLFGWLHWLADNLLCYSHLLPLKEQVGYPWRFFLELHGFWHWWSGYGSYLIVTYLVAARVNVVARDPRAENARHAVAWSEGGKVWDTGVRWIGGFLPVIVVGSEARQMHAATAAAAGKGKKKQ
ncbi:ceramidase-domain-containing protein [Blastocladiella britannica]|nr:ceramidase-domain-containing protein [Blastocladiella britannica]